MDRTHIDTELFYAIWDQYLQSEAELEDAKLKPDGESFLEVQMDAMINAVVEQLEDNGYKNGIDASDDIFVNLDFSARWSMCYDLINKKKRREIEDSLQGILNGFQNRLCILTNGEIDEATGTEYAVMITREHIYISHWRNG